MKQQLLVLNHSALFLGTSIYLGTGWSTAIFQFPVMPLLTPENYRLHFIPQIDAATTFFTILVTVMVLTAAIMIWSEWKTGFRWLPIAVLATVVAATCLTVFVIFPVNDALRAGVTEQTMLDDLLARWQTLTWVRVGLWSFEWLAMMFYFAAKARAAGVGRTAT